VPSVADLLFIYSPNSDGFYIFYISQGSVATQLRCGGMFSNHFIANFPQNAPVKKNLKIGQYLTKIGLWTKLCGLLFWATLYIQRRNCTGWHDQASIFNGFRRFPRYISETVKDKGLVKCL